MAIEFNVNNNERTTFALLRTNPKLTSNVKLVVDSNGSISMSSFKSNKTLSGSNFQRFELNEHGSYSTDVSKFFRGVSTNEIYQDFRKFSDITAFNDFKHQYENQYNYGASFNTTKVYDEQYKILAPIWMEREIPSKFVIYRINNTDYSNEYEDTSTGQNNRIAELLREATIIKHFDLTKESKLGLYLHNHVFNKELPTSLIDANFSAGGLTTFNGIDVVDGGFASKGEYIINELVKTEHPEIFFNENITQAFERNNIVSGNIINLEFMFDDSDALNYEIYRYFGLYVNEVPESKFDIDNIDSENIVLIKKDTVESFYELDGISPEAMIPTVDDLKIPSLNYLKAGNETYHHIKNNFGFLNDAYGHKLPISIDNSNDVLDNFKKDDTIKIINKKAGNRGFIKISIVDIPAHNDRFFLGDINEIKGNDYDLEEFIFIADSSLSPGMFSGNNFSCNGNISQVTLAIQNAITFYRTEYYKSTIIIEDYAIGNNVRSMALGIFVQNLNNFINFEYASIDGLGLNQATIPIGVQTNFNEWNIYTTLGGSKEGAVLLVDKSELGKLKIGDFVKAKNKNKYVELIDITTDLLNDNIFRIIFKSPVVISNDSVIQTYVKYKTEIGKFSAYDFKDFDFDFHSNDMSNIGELIYSDDTDYFKNLTPVLQEETIKDPVNTDILKSEYDRLDENKLKETSIKSRIVPIINKFALKDGSNARNLPYVLNISEVFGVNNMSPDIENLNGRSVDLLNMEHFHINKIPSAYYGRTDSNELVNNLQSYLDFNYSGGISDQQLKSTNTDYFSLYFKYDGVYNPNEGVWMNSSRRTLFSKFSGGSSEMEASAVFRGLRYLYKERTEFNFTNPLDFVNNSKVNDYKFGVILNYVAKQDSNEVFYNVIKNDKFKFICVTIDVTTQSNDEYIDRKKLYELIDITDDTSKPINTNISFDINLIDPRTNWNEENPIVYSLNDGKFDTEITKDSNGDNSWIIWEDLNGNSYGLKVASVISSDSIRVEGLPRAYNPSNGSFSSPVNNVSTTFSLGNTNFNYLNGGNSGFKALFEEFVSYNFANRFNKYGDISYTTITKTGDILKNEFVLSVEDGIELIKPSVLTTETDSNRPKSYQLSSNEIGRVLATRDDGGYYTVIKRMNGKYNPIFKDVITFTDINTRYKQNLPEIGSSSIDIINREELIYYKLKNLGVAFESYKELNDNYGFIENYYYHKANDHGIKNLLKLSDSSDKKPLYPMIGEIAIDAKRLNLFKSKYSKDYFTRSISSNKTENVHGTLNPIEDKSFMVSTIMKVSDTYDITRYTTVLENNLNDLDSIRFNNTNTGSIHWIETESQIISDIYLPNSIKDELLEDGILDKFRKYVDPKNSYGDKDSIKDDLEVYVYNNIINRFVIDSIKIYGINGKDITSGFDSVISEEEIKNNKYTIETNFEIQSYQNDSLSFRLIYNKRLGYGHKLRVLVKIQA